MLGHIVMVSFEVSPDMAPILFLIHKEDAGALDSNVNAIPQIELYVSPSTNHLLITANLKWKPYSTLSKYCNFFTEFYSSGQDTCKGNDKIARRSECKNLFFFWNNFKTDNFLELTQPTTRRYEVGKH